MANTTQLGALKYAPVDANSTWQVQLDCIVLPNGASAPSFKLTSEGSRPKGFKTVTRSGVGVLVVTLEEPWWGVLQASAMLNVSPTAGQSVGVTTINGSGPKIGAVTYPLRGASVFTLTTYTVSTGAAVDVAAGANNQIHLQLTLLSGAPI